jgi:hypothetical protein
MATVSRVFYSSENGDEWLLVSKGQRVLVRHHPNAASGGKGREVDLGAFLSREENTPQNRALRELLSSLVPDRPNVGESELLKALRQAARS